MFSLRYILTVQFFLLLYIIGYGQNCYDEIFKGTGLTPSFTDSVDAHACVLKNTFPEEIQSNFGTYTASHYVISQYYGEDFTPQVISDLVNEAANNTPFYLFFIWNQEGNKLYNSVEVKLNLPLDGHFECTSDLKREALRVKLQNIANEYMADEFSLYTDAEQIAIDSLQAFVSNAIECCDPNFRNTCSICLTEQEVESIFEDLFTVSYQKKYSGLSPSVDNNADTEDISGSNYNIKELHAVNINEGTEIRLKQKLANYFSQNALEVFWDVLIMSNEACDENTQNKVRIFLQPDDTNSGAIKHKLLVAFNGDDQLKFSTYSNDWLLHPINFSDFSLLPLLITHSDCPVLQPKNSNGEFIDFAAFTPAGTLITFPVGTKVSFQPRDGELGSYWPAGCVDGFRKDGLLYWGDWDQSKNVFLGYKCQSSANPLQSCSQNSTYFIPVAKNAETVVAVVAYAENGCRADYHARSWQASDESNLHVNVEEENIDEALPVLQSLSNIPPFIKSLGIIPNNRCLGETEACRRLYQDYLQHPYFQGYGPLSRIVNEDPCLIATLEHYNFNVIEKPLEFTEGLKNICAVMLAAGFAPALLSAGAIAIESVIQAIGVDKLKDTVVGFSMDLLLQIVIKYYFPANGVDITWEEAVTSDHNYTQALASGGEALIATHTSNVWVGLAVSATTSCLVDGFTDQSGQIDTNFSGVDCGTGVLSALLVGGFLNSFPWIKNYLQDLTKKYLAKGIARLVSKFVPSIHLSGGPISEGNGIGYKLYKYVHGDVIQAEDVIALFDISPDQASNIATQITNNPALKDLLLKSDWWAHLRKMTTSPNFRGELLNDLVNDINFANALNAKSFVDQEKLVNAWDALISSPALRNQVDNLKYVDDYVAKHPGTLSSIKSNFNNLPEARRQSFLNGVRNGSLDPLDIATARRATPDEVSSAVNKIADHRSSVGNPSNGNYGYLEGNVGNTVPDGVPVRSGAPDTDIPEIFDAIPVNNQNIPGGEGAWVRITDSEYKMLNRLAHQLGAQPGGVYPDFVGTLKIASERSYCPSCAGVIQQFDQMYPNVNLILVDGIR